MNVFITGASGFIGSFLSEELIKQGHTVHALVMSKDPLRWIADLDVKCIFGDLRNTDSLRNVIQKADYIYHLAGITRAIRSKDFYEVNYLGTKNLVETVLKTGADIKRFVYISSQAAVGPSPTIEPLDESQPPRPISEYGKSKLAAENYLDSIKEKLPITVIRPASVYGPRDQDILQFFKTVKWGIIPQLGYKERYLSLIHVRDLVEGIIQAAQAPKTRGGTYFMANLRPYSWEEVAKTILNIYGKKGVRILIPEIFLSGVAAISQIFSRIRHKPPVVNTFKLAELKQRFWVCTPRLAEKDFGFKTRITLDEGIRETVEWYVQNQWL